MLYPHRVSLTIIILSIVVLACALPTIALQDPSAISTTAAQTVIAKFTQAALSEILPLPTTRTNAHLYAWSRQLLHQHRHLHHRQRSLGHRFLHPHRSFR